MVDTTTGVGTTTAATATANINSQSTALAGNYNMFLDLLTTQLQNQDPLNPMDNNQFTQQLTQMTGVQQQLLTNQLLTQMLSQNQAGVSGSAVGLIGKQVTMTTPETTLTNGSATWDYNLPSAATTITASVTDASGNIVTTLTPTGVAKGDNTLTWNGKDSNGATVADGVYNLNITATDSAGNAVTATESYSGVATGLATDSTGTTDLTIGAISAPVSSVTSVKAAA